MLAYIMVCGMPALPMYRSFCRGVTPRRVFTMVALTAFATAIFEITGINSGLYVYYGDSPRGVVNYPLFIAFMEGAQIMGAAQYCRHHIGSILAARTLAILNAVV